MKSVVFKGEFEATWNNNFCEGSIITIFDLCEQGHCWYFHFVCTKVQIGMGPSEATLMGSKG